MSLNRERLFEGLPQVGGHPALDLMNTVEYRGRFEPGDRLNSLDRLLAWSEMAGLIDQDESRDLRRLASERPGNAERALRDIAHLREEARNALGARLNGKIDLKAMEFLRARVERAARGVRVMVDNDGISFKRGHEAGGFDELVDRIALSIENLFGLAGRELLRECEGENCDWLFFDRSRSRHRRWCHPGQCGNAARVRNFRARRSAAPAKKQD
ncbi:CGNR zinc finger domain-containing protein [Sphingomonas sp. NSE70-1]|uniref:CGNR zinc finger domain-containing protein n=1 Tax=Sphingomonas caseinilyticus TaxID=2908205 RepID=A0ABT0RUK1_9SPHN|nr:CGNR zinc finger domain-containing protein [Sphingomonas caseinilyticus]MCL6698601.1 CGNR zinc finger domain-containing protein [Sphingomonas caseinilyticus]